MMTDVAIKVGNEFYNIDTDTLTVYATVDRHGKQRGSTVSGFGRDCVLQEYLSQHPDAELAKRIEELERNEPIPYAGIDRANKMAKEKNPNVLKDLIVSDLMF